MSIVDEEKRSKLAGILALHFPYSHNFKTAIDEIEALFKPEEPEHFSCRQCTYLDDETQEHCNCITSPVFRIHEDYIDSFSCSEGGTCELDSSN